jgi:hypothetical protein
MWKCSFCPRFEGVEGAICQGCGGVMCSHCLKLSKMRPAELWAAELKDLSHWERRVFSAAYADGDFRCNDCRYKTANEQVERYLARDSWPDDPLLWVAEVTAAGLACDHAGIIPVPGLPEGDYDPVPSFLHFVRAKAIPPISCERRQPEDHQPGTPTPTDSVTGWLVERGGVHRTWESMAWEGGSWEDTACPILVCSDGRCFALRARGRDRYEAMSEVIKRQLQIGGRQGAGYWLSPYAFLEAAKELATPPK